LPVFTERLEPPPPPPLDPPPPPERPEVLLTLPPDDLCAFDNLIPVALVSFYSVSVISTGTIDL
jgi:hypothetical protein